MSRRSKSSIIFEPVNSTDPCKTIVQSNLNVKKDATLKCDLDVKKCLNVKNVIYCEENIDETYQNISSDISLTWVNTNGEGVLEEGKKDGMYKKIVKTVTGSTADGWSPVGTNPNNFFNSDINTIALDPNNEDNVYVGGVFTSPYPFIAKWDGSSWIPVGIPGDFNNAIRKITFNPVTGEGPYVGGDFTSVGGDPNLNYLAKWDGSGWTSVNPGGDGIIGSAGTSIRDIAFDFNGEGPYIAGQFQNLSGNTGLNVIAKWNGTSWISIVNSPALVNPSLVSNSIEFQKKNNSIFFSLFFPFTSGIYVATQFLSDLGGTDLFLIGGDFIITIGVADPITKIKISPDENFLYVGGFYSQFSEYGSGNTGVACGISKIDISNIQIGIVNKISNVGLTPCDFNVFAGQGVADINFSPNGVDPYIGGNFISIAGNTNLKNVGKWNGYKWESIDNFGIDVILQPPNISNKVLNIQFTSDNKTTYIGGFFYDPIFSYTMIAQYTPQSYRITYNKGCDTELLIDEGDCVSFIYNEDLEEWIKLN